MHPRIPARLILLTALLALTATVVPARAAEASSSVAALQARIESALIGIGASHVDYRIEDVGVGTIRHHALTKTAPASNEKLLTTIAALHFLTPTFRYSTPVEATAPIVGGTLTGDLVLVGSGDPTLTFANLHRMATQLHALGLNEVTGHLIVDDTRYSQRTVLPGWKRDFVPIETGTMDAFSLNGNEWRTGAAFNHDPTPYNAAIWRQELKRAHITIAKRTVIAAAPPITTPPLVVHQSKPLATIIATTLRDSVNFYAEMLLRELGAFRTGHGTPASGINAVKTAARQLNLPIGTIYDGSGLSYSDRETPATLVAWLDAARTTPYFDTLYNGLPVSCETGTLKHRLCGPHVRDRIRGKTGTLNHVSTLSGYLTTESGHQVSFSILVSGFPDSKYNRIYRHVDAALAEVCRHG